MRTWVGWFGFLETFEVTAATITVGANLFFCIILSHDNRTFTPLLRTIVRIKVCKVDLAPAKTKISRHINDSGHPLFSLCRQKPPFRTAFAVKKLPLNRNINKRIEGTIAEMVEEALAFCKRNMKTVAENLW